MAWSGSSIQRSDRPLLVAAFSGWNDAGDAATGAADWLVRQRDARRIASIDPDEHIDYQSHRPQVELVDGVAARDHVAGERLLRGHRSVNATSSCCAASSRTCGGSRSATRCWTSRRRRGARWSSPSARLLGDVPHTRPVRVTGTASDPAAHQRARAHPFAVRRAPPASSACSHDACRAGGLRSASLWAPVPHYVRHAAQPAGDPRRCSSASAQLADLPLDLHGLDQLVDLWRVQVDHAIRDNDEVTDYVRELEGRVDAEDAGERGIVLGGHPGRGRLRPQRRRPRRRGRAVPARAGRRRADPFAAAAAQRRAPTAAPPGARPSCAWSPASCS